MKFQTLFKKARFKLNKTQALLIIILTLGFAFRVYDLNWGAPFYFHPDERNVASAVTRLSLPENLNPEFFAYGSLPIYSIYFLGLFIIFLQSLLNLTEFSYSIPFELAIVVSRAFSAVLSTLIIFLIFKSARLFTSERLALVTTALAALSIGMIQYAHFGTFEIWLTFFTLLTFYSLSLFLLKKNIGYFLVTILLLGILISIKVSSFVLLPVVLLASFYFFFISEERKKHLLKRAVRFFATVVISIFAPFIIFVLLNPYALIDQTAFLSSIKYESSVAMGTLPVFYTGSFFDTQPFIYHVTHVYPFLLNPFVAAIFYITFPFFVLLSFRKRDHFLLLLLFFAVLFVSQTILFVKWTRYLIPTLPFVYLILVITLERGVHFLQKEAWIKSYSKWSTVLLFLTSFLFAFSFIKTVYINTDTRIAAANYAASIIPGDAKIISEVYDMGIVPFNGYFSNITLFNFYDLEHIPSSKYELSEELADTEFIILPSSRILRTRLLQKKHFPEGNSFYQKLYLENGYKLIYKTPCDIFCRIAYLGNSLNMLEETAYVFDRPTLYIYEKTN